MSTCITNHSIALLNNGIVEYVVAANTHDKAIISNILNQCPPHEEAISSCGQGYEIYIGCQKFKDKVREPSPFLSWLYDYEENKWKAPVDYPSSAKTIWEYRWDEDTLSWVLCNCLKVN